MNRALSDWAQLQTAHELDVYGKRGITLIRGEGAWVYDSAGNRYLDCIAGNGTASLGHGHPAVLGALSKQASRLISCSGAFANDARARYMEALAAVLPTGLQRMFFCNSGAEAVEAALKLARLLTGRSKIIATEGGFHGRTLGALSATANPIYREGFGPLLPGFSHVPFNDATALLTTVDDDTAAVILEIVQGEGGVHPADASYVDAARALCDQHSALLIFDEVQTGFCRTGAMFAWEHLGVLPDLLCLAKGIAAGMPMGALICRDGVEVPVGSHGSTFGGNPLACAVAEASLSVMLRDGLAAAAQRQGRRLATAIHGAQLSRVVEVRQHGLMIGIELRERVRPILQELMAEGMLALAAGPKVLRLLPPLTIDDEQIDLAARLLIRVLRSQ